MAASLGPHQAVNGAQLSGQKGLTGDPPSLVRQVPVDTTGSGALQGLCVTNSGQKEGTRWPGEPLLSEPASQEVRTQGSGARAHEPSLQQLGSCFYWSARRPEAAPTAVRGTATPATGSSPSGLGG